MPRTARKGAETDLYHVIVRGTGRQIIFEDDADRRRYLRLLSHDLTEHEGALLAWCLMDNHAHLLFHMPLEEVSALMRTLGSSYALWFNERHDRVGHLFQGRFRSEPIESEAYLLTVVRYIHQNPLKAGLCAACDEWPWSSYRSYLRGEKDTRLQELIDCDLVLGLLGGTTEFEQFHLIADEAAPCLDMGRATSRRFIPDEEALHVARAVLRVTRPEEVRALPRPRRDEALRTLRGARLSIRQIERITGVSRGVVSRACRMRVTMGTEV
ncbi:transposase [Thermophilibacter sp.]